MQNWMHFQTVLHLCIFYLSCEITAKVFFNKQTPEDPSRPTCSSPSMWRRAPKGNLIVFFRPASATLWYNSILAILPKEITPCIGSIFCGEQHGQLHSAIISRYSSGVGLYCDISDPHTGGRKFKYMTAECNEKALLDSLSLSCLPPLPLSGTFICLLL